MPRQNGLHFTDDTFKRIFLNKNVRISIKTSLKFVPKGTIDNIPVWVQMMVWRKSGDKPSSEPMMVNLLTHICANELKIFSVNSSRKLYDRIQGKWGNGWMYQLTAPLLSFSLHVQGPVRSIIMGSTRLTSYRLIAIIYLNSWVMLLDVPWMADQNRPISLKVIFFSLKRKQSPVTQRHRERDYHVY